MSKKIITLISNDDKTFEILRPIAEFSVTIHNILSDNDSDVMTDSDEITSKIPLPNITGDIFVQSFTILYLSLWLNLN